MKIIKILNGRQKRLFSYLSLFLALFLFFGAVFFGLDFTDSFYHLNQALHPAGDQHLYPFLGSSLLIREIVELLGPKVIFLRLANSLLLFISFLFPILILKPQLFRNKILFHLACGLILFLPFNVNILGYDTLSIFFLSLIFSISIDHIKKPKLSKLLFLSILCSAAVLVRLPNILVLLIITLWLLLFTKDFPKTLLYRWQAVIFISFSVVGIAVVYASYYGSWDRLLGASANSNSHFIKELLQNYLRDGIQLLFFLSFILISYYLFQRLQERISQVFTYFLFVLILLIFLRHYVLPTKYIFNYSLFIFAIILAYTTIQIIHRKKQTCLQLQIYVLYFLFLFINLFGSNTGLLKGYSLFVLFPFMFGIGNSEGKNYWTVLLLLLIPFSLVNKIYGIYEDKNMLLLTETPKTELLSPIRTNKSRAQYLDAIDAELKELRSMNINVYFYGDKSHIFHYLYPDSSLGIVSFFQPVDNLEVYPVIRQKFRSERKIAIFVQDSYPRNTPDISILELALVKNGFVKVEKGGAVFYLKNTSEEEVSIKLSQFFMKYKYECAF